MVWRVIEAAAWRPPVGFHVWCLHRTWIPQGAAYLISNSFWRTTTVLQLVMCSYNINYLTKQLWYGSFIINHSIGCEMDQTLQVFWKPGLKQRACFVMLHTWVVCIGCRLSNLKGGSTTHINIWVRRLICPPDSHWPLLQQALGKRTYMSWPP